MIVNSYFQLADWPSDIDLIVTSPPYKDEDNYSDALIEELGNLSFKNLKDNSWLFMNFGHMANFKSRPFRAAMILENCGFKWNDTVTWVKNHYKPIQGVKRVNNLTEFVFIMSKGSPSMDRLSIGVPYADKSNIKRWKGTEGKDIKCRGNVWNVNYKTINNSKDKLHNDRFPVELPELCIKLSGIGEKSLVVDPFMGSGTTAIASLNLNMKYWGCEKNPQNYKTLTERISNHENHI